jgi:hypothetical protein
MQPITLSLDLVNAILQYMGTRPYNEVFQIVNAINQVGIPQLQAAQAQAEAEAPSAEAEAPTAVQ